MVINETEVYPIYADTDAMSIVYHGAYVPWLELGRTNLMTPLIKKFERETGIKPWLPIIKLDVRYKNPAMLYEKLIVRTKVKSMKAATIEFAYEIVGKDSGELHVSASSTHPITDTNRTPLNIKKDHREFYDLIIKMMNDD